MDITQDAECSEASTSCVIVERIDVVGWLISAACSGGILCTACLFGVLGLSIISQFGQVRFFFFFLLL